MFMYMYNIIHVILFFWFFLFCVSYSRTSQGVSYLYSTLMFACVYFCCAYVAEWFCVCYRCKLHTGLLLISILVVALDKIIIPPWPSCYSTCSNTLRPKYMQWGYETPWVIFVNTRQCHGEK